VLSETHVPRRMIRGGGAFSSCALDPVSACVACVHDRISPGGLVHVGLRPRRSGRLHDADLDSGVTATHYSDEADAYRWPGGGA